MSAFILPKEHIDLLITAGLDLPSPGRVLRWLHPAYYDEPGLHQAGAPWGPGAIEAANKWRRELRRDTAGSVGAILTLQNQRSVNYRYAEDELEQPYVFEPVPGILHNHLPEILGAIACYEYQSCETPDWERTEAYALCQSLTETIVDRIRKTERTWPFTNRARFGTATRMT